jgi:diguanylate cyclase
VRVAAEQSGAAGDPLGVPRRRPSPNPPSHRAGDDRRPHRRRRASGGTGPAPPERPVRVRWWLFVPGVGIPLAVLAAALPAPLAEVAFNALQVCTLAVAAAALLRMPRRARTGWTLILGGRAVGTLAGLAASAGAGSAAMTLDAGGGGPAYPSWLALLFLLQYPLVAAGLFRLARREAAGPGVVVDAAVITGVAAIGGWLLVIEPQLRTASISAVALTTAIGYVVLDLVLVAAALRLIRSGGRAPASHLVLAAGVCCVVAADTGYFAARPGVVVNGLTGLLWLLWGVAAAAAAVAAAGSARTLANSTGAAAAAAGAPPAALSRRRFVGFCVLALLAPLAPALQPGVPVGALVPAALAAVLALLLVVRLAMLAAVAGHTAEVLEYTRAQREALRDELRHRASHDPLTGLASRAALTAYLTGPARRQRESLVLIDLDGFAALNDAHGHPIGDDLLTEVAVRLRTALPAARVLARLGGDEFAALHRGDGATAARRALTALRPAYRIGGRDLHLTASAGVVEIRSGRDAAQALRDADLALDAAKSAGGDRTVTFHPELREALLRRSDLADSLRGASERGELELAFQPVVDLGTGRMVAAEALMRWRRDGESVPPAQFIPLAEQTGLIVPIGWWALTAAIAQAGRWHRRYGVAVTVNVSAHQLRADDFVDRVLGTLDGAGVPGSAVVLELTESTLIADVDAAEQALHRLRARGVRIAVDDFGTGYSSLSYLMALPVDILKLDRAFVAATGYPPDKQHAITGAVLQLAAVLDLTTIAEGVETDAQATALRQLGCPLAQGYLYSPPVPASGVDALLAEWNPTLAAASGM